MKMPPPYRSATSPVLNPANGGAAGFGAESFLNRAIYASRRGVPEKNEILYRFCSIFRLDLSGMGRSLFPLLLHAVTPLFLPRPANCLLPLPLAPSPAPSLIPGRTRPTGRPCPPENSTPPQQCSRLEKTLKCRILAGFCLILRRPCFSSHLHWSSEIP